MVVLLKATKVVVSVVVVVVEHGLKAVHWAYKVALLLIVPAAG
jgi:hypothetical protein